MSKTDKKNRQLDIEDEIVERRFRAVGNYDADKASMESGLECKDDKTMQSFKDESDINKIVDRFLKTGQVPAAGAPVFADITASVDDFRDAMDVIVMAEREFMKLPGRVRAQFGNDPTNLMAFLDDKANYDEAVQMGLLKPKEGKTQVSDKSEKVISETPK